MPAYTMDIMDGEEDRPPGSGGSDDSDDEAPPAAAAAAAAGPAQVQPPPVRRAPATPPMDYDDESSGSEDEPNGTVRVLAPPAPGMPNNLVRLQEWEHRPLRVIFPANAHRVLPEARWDDEFDIDDILAAEHDAEILRAVAEEAARQPPIIHNAYVVEIPLEEAQDLADQQADRAAAEERQAMMEDEARVNATVDEAIQAVEDAIQDLKN